MVLRSEGHGGHSRAGRLQNRVAQVGCRFNECMFFHGTDQVAAKAVCSSGVATFIVGVSTGTLYGDGTYFAEFHHEDGRVRESSQGRVVLFLLLQMAGGHVTLNDAFTPDAENLFKALVSGKRTVFPVAARSRNTFQVQGVRDLQQRPVLCRVHPLVQADTQCKANSRYACACSAHVSGCSLTIGAFTSSTGCPAHGCTRLRINPFAYFTEDGQKANWIFAQLGRSQADRVQRKTTHCEWSHFHIARVCFPTGTLLHCHCA